MRAARFMAARVRPYLFYDATVAICSRCYRRVDAKTIVEDGRVFLTKRCPEHGRERVLIADDVDYWRRSREVFLKPPELPIAPQTAVEWGCPLDCGLCPDHEQHSCIAVIELGDACNLQCPICYAESGPHRPNWRSLSQVEAMLDAVVKSEGEPDVVQLSGGEPSLHPEISAVLKLARSKPIRHLMLNTNGVRIAEDRAFAEELAELGPGFEVYLQFDSLEREPLEQLRGGDLRKVRRRAVATLNELGISTTLVVTLSKGLNDHECGAIIDYALEQPAVRGVTFQPIQDAGRVEGFDPATDRLTLTEVRRSIYEQSSVFTAEDLVPVPCHPDCIAMAYAVKHAGEVHPLTRYVPAELLIEGGRNTIRYEAETGLQERIFQLFSTHHSPASSAEAASELLCCLPRVDGPKLGYENLFRVVIMQFLDAHSMDLRSVRKSCVHIVHPDGRIIPFDTYNLFYRDGLEESRTARLREARSTAPEFTTSPSP